MATKKGRAENGSNWTAESAAGLTFEQFLQRVGYKALKFPSFENWLKGIFDANGNGQIDRGGELRSYRRVINNTGKSNEYLAEYQHAQAAAMAADNATVDNLRLLWQQGNAEAAKEVASRDALEKERNNMAAGSAGTKKINPLLLAAAGVALILILK